MKKTTSSTSSAQPTTGFAKALDEILRRGARKMLMNVIEAEVASYIDSYATQLDENGKRLVVRNGYLPKREIIAGIGPVEVHQPRVHDRRENHRFTSRILPPFMRSVPSVEALIPCLYLKGISTGDFSKALEAILGPNSPGLSATNIVRLKEVWNTEYQQWQKRDLGDKHYVYIWIDGIHFNVRLDDERSCILVIIGATEDGKKELLAVQDVYRESKLSWQGMLRNLKDRKLRWLPNLAVGDGALGFWATMEKEFPTIRRQRCWVHKTANVLDKMPKSVQGKAKEQIFACTWPTLGKRLRRPTISLYHSTRPSIPRHVNASIKTRRTSSLSTISLRNIGFTSVPRIQSNRRSPPLGCGQNGRKAADLEGRL